MFSSFYATDNSVQRVEFDNLWDLSGAPEGPHRKGTFWGDVNNKRYNKKWPSMAAFQTWMNDEQEICQVKFVKAYKNGGINYGQQVYSCSSGRTDGTRNYQKKEGSAHKNLLSRKTDCPMVLIIKTYPGVDIVLGCYEQRHNHDTTMPNLNIAVNEKGSKERNIARSPPRVVRGSEAVETALKTISRPSSSGATTGDNLLQQIRNVAVETHPLEGLPTDVLHSVAHSSEILRR